MSLKLNERYPARFNNPTAGYPQGSFKNRTTPTAKDGSYLEKDWANDKEGFFQSLLSAAGITANGAVDAVGASQYYSALLSVITSQNTDLLNTTRIDVASAATVNLTSSAPSTRHINITGTTSITAFTVTVGQIYFVRFAASLVLTENAEIVTQSGASITTQAGDTCLIRATAANVVEVLCYSRALSSRPSGVSGLGSAMVVSTTGASAVVTIAADEVMLSTASGAYMTARAVNVTASFLVAGIGGIDTGAANSQLVNTWWYPWLASNGTAVVAFLSLSPTAPTLPAGYIYKAPARAVRIDGTTNRFPLGMTWTGNRWSWKVTAGTNVPSLPLMASGAVGSVTAPTWIAVPWANFAPPGAKRIVVVSSNGSGTSIVAPNNSYGASTSTTNPSPVQNSAGTAQLSWLADLILESANIYWAANAGGAGLFAAGGEL